MKLVVMYRVNKLIFSCYIYKIDLNVLVLKTKAKAKKEQN